MSSGLPASASPLDPASAASAASAAPASSGVTGASGASEPAAVAPPLGRAVGVWGPAAALARREAVRFFRQRSRVTGALLTPVVFWLLLGSGLNHNFVLQPGAQDASATQYMAYFFPGTIVMIVLFTAIFSTFSVIEDRHAGFMQAVLASPAPRLSIVLGKVVGCAGIAAAQATLFLLAWPFVAKLSVLDAGLWLRMLGCVPLMFILGAGLASLGLTLAWRIDSTAGFHAVMNLLLMPMWFLSGAVFPLPPAGPVRYLMLLNPLTYGQAAFTSWLTARPGATMLPFPDPLAGAIALACAAAATLWAVRTVSRVPTQHP